MIKRIGVLSYRGKILCTYLVLLVLTIAVFVICYMQGLSAAQDYNISFMSQTNVQRNMYLDAVMGNNSSLNVIHLIDSRINIILHEQTKTMSSVQRYERESYLQNTLKMLTVINPNVLRASVLTATEDVYCSVSSVSDEYITEIDAFIDQTDWENRSQKRYTGVYQHMIGPSNYQIVTVIHPLFDIGSDENFAYLLIDLDFGAIAKDFNQEAEKAENMSGFAIISQKEVIFQSQHSPLNLTEDLTPADQQEAFRQLKEIGNSDSLSGTVSFPQGDYIAAVRQNEKTGWYLIHYLPRQVLVSTSMESMKAVMYAVVIILILAGALSLILSKQVSRPIKRLSETMAQARQGEVKLYEDEVTRKDEIGQLIDIYNAMGTRINDSITKLYVAQLNQKQTELKMLQFQINPHFLYNALNTVSAIARLEDIEEIPEITESLCDMFRYNIKGSDFVTLGEELAQLKNYLRIQAIRFPGRFVIEYDVPEQLSSCGMIKFVLQPIVENSMKHAFTVKREHDSLKLSAYIQNQSDLVIEIYDDGCGIGREQVDKINRMMADTRANALLEENEGGIGLVNVNARLKNFYGEDYGLRIESELGRYTRIYLKLKIKET